VLPPRSVLMHPGIVKLVVVAWKSPINGRVSATGSFTDIDPGCGDGVLWSIDKGATTIRSGDIPNGGGESFSVVVSVRKDQVVYCTVDRKAESSGDGRRLQLVITRVDAD